MVHNWPLHSQVPFGEQRPLEQQLPAGVRACQFAQTVPAVAHGSPGSMKQAKALPASGSVGL